MIENPYITFYEGNARMRGEIPAMKLFVYAYKEIPCTADWTTEGTSYYDYKTIMKILSEYKHSPSED